MPELVTGLASAMWLGILTSMSPCPMATNIAAVSFVARRVTRPSRVLLTGVLYTMGRVGTYTVLGVLLSASLLSAPGVSRLLQEHMNEVLGPALIVVGMILLDLIRFRPSGGVGAEKLQKRVETMGIWASLLLGAVFAASFCPISAALFFGSLLSIAIRTESTVLMPAVYGVGTGLPVLVFALLFAAGAKSLGSTYNRIAAFEKWARRLTGGIFIVVGTVYCLRHIFRLPI